MYTPLVSIIGSRVQLKPHTDRWAKGDRFATVIDSDGCSGIALIFKLKFDRSGDIDRYADTNFKVLPL